jgi:hypothetical protein
MIYDLQDLLIKMGAPEVRQRQRIEWRYFDPITGTLTGHAAIRLEANGAVLAADLKHERTQYEDDDGRIHDRFIETFQMHAVQLNNGRFKIERICFDGAEYSQPSRPIIELGLSIFHARALDISVMMVEQEFNKMDILSRDTVPQPVVFPARPAAVQQQGNGVVVAFRPRGEARAV